MATIYLVMQMDPYDYDDGETPVEAHLTFDGAIQGCKDRYDKIFGLNSHHLRKKPYGSGPDWPRYFDVSEIQLKE